MDTNAPEGADETAEDGGTEAIDRDDAADVNVPDAGDDAATADTNAADNGVPDSQPDPDASGGDEEVKP